MTGQKALEMKIGQKMIIHIWGLTTQDMENPQVF